MDRSQNRNMSFNHKQKSYDQAAKLSFKQSMQQELGQEKSVSEVSTEKKFVSFLQQNSVNGRNHSDNLKHFGTDNSDKKKEDFSDYEGMKVEQNIYRASSLGFKGRSSDNENNVNSSGSNNDSSFKRSITSKLSVSKQSKLSKHSKHSSSRKRRKSTRVPDLDMNNLELETRKSRVIQIDDVEGLDQSSENRDRVPSLREA